MHRSTSPSSPLRRGLALLALLAVAGSPAPVLAAGADALLRVSGYDAQLAELPRQIKAGVATGALRSLGDPAAADELDALSASVDAAFDPAPLRAALVETLESDLAAPQLAALLDWYGSALGERLTAAEVAAAAPEAQEDMVRSVPELMADPERVARAQRMARINDITDFVIAQQRRSMMATALLVSEFAAPGETPDLDLLSDQLDEMEPAMRMQVMQSMLAGYLYTYRDFTLEEIDRYLAFLETEASRTFTERSLQTILRMGEQIVDAMLADLGARLLDRSHRRERDAA
jgi:hypothetical protein